MLPIIGHKEIVDDLKRLVAKAELSHGYIFYGPTMVGKRTTALALARFLERGEFEPPAENEVLQDAKLINLAFAKQLDPNLKDSISIDAVREIKNFLWQKPNVSSKRTLIIDDAELLTTEAQSALLKITEEPPASSLLIIITSDIQSMMGTIQSRLQKIYFGAVAEADTLKWLTGGLMLPQAKAVPLAKKALGKPGLAWKLAYDEDFQNNLELAERFLKTTPTARKDFLKKLIAPEDFSLRNFLDALIINLAWGKSSKIKAELWHKTLALYRDISNFSLNHRLQLENLLMN